jgi:hypothetical protein
MATITSTQSGLWSEGATWVGGSVPANGDDVVIAAGHEVQVDSSVDHENDSIVLTGIVIQGGASPGMLYWKDDAVNGCGNIASSGNVSGTNDTNNGRLLANSDGSWATNTALSYTYSAIIRMSSTGSVDCENLDVKMVPDNPTQGYLTPYANGTKQDFDAATDVDPSTDTITINTHGLSEGDVIGFYAGANTLPTGLEENMFYYVRSVAENTFKVASRNGDAHIVDITADGSGTCFIYEGVASGKATLDVFEDVTGDNWTAGDTVVLANIDDGNYDQQHNITVDTINAASVVLSASTDSNQNPGARIWLSTRNCSILHSSTSNTQSIVKNGDSCQFGEIRASAGTGTTFSCHGVYSGSGHTVTTISGCSIGVYYGSGHTVTTISGCNNGINSGSGHTVTTISGCSNGVYTGSGHTVTTISGCNNGVYSGSGHTVTTISGCNNGVYFGSGHTVTTISGCNKGIDSGSHNTVSNMSGNTVDFIETYIVFASGGTVPATPTNGSLNQDGEVSMMLSGDHNGTYGAHKIIQSFGDAVKVDAGDGDPVPNQRSGGNDELVELSNLQSNLSGGSADNKVIAWEPGKVRVYATSGTSKTYRFYVQSTFALTASQFKLIGKYHDSGVDTGWATTESDETISVRDDLDDWDQYVEVTINPSRTGWVIFDIELRLYNSGGRVYIDPLVVIS